MRLIHAIALLFVYGLIGQCVTVVTARPAQGAAGQPARDVDAAAQSPVMRIAVPVRDTPDGEEPDDDDSEDDEPGGDDPDEEDPDEPGVPPGTPPLPRPTDPIFTVRPGASLTWDQDVNETGAAAQMQFVLFVDEVRSPLSGVRCAASAAAGEYECTVRIPPLTAGIHSLSLSADGGGALSPRSETIFVRAEAAATTVLGGLVPGPAARGAATLTDPSDFLVVSRHLTLVAERAGRVRVLHGSLLDPEPALTLPDVLVGEGHGLLALSAGADVARTGSVYLLYSTPNGLRLARAQLSGSRLSRPATIVDGLPMSARHPQAVLRVGPDGSLFVALEDVGAATRAFDFGDWAGKLLRFAPDGTTPRDQKAGSPIVMGGLHKPSGLDWDRQAGTLWMTDRGPDGALVLHQRAAGRADRGSVVTRLSFPKPVGRAALVASAFGGPGLLVGVTAEHGQRLGLRRLEISAEGRITGSGELPVELDSGVISLAMEGPAALMFLTSRGLGRLSLK